MKAIDIMKKLTVALASLAFAACTGCIKHNIDNSYSKSNSIMEIQASATSVVLDESGRRGSHHKLDASH